MIRVLFVCLGNICRSPMAEAVFRDMVRKAGLDHKIEVDSAGTGDWHVGKPPHEGTQAILNRYMINFEGLKARQLSKDDLLHFDYVVAMDSNNISAISEMGDGKPVIKKLLDFTPAKTGRDVPDPYFTGNFDETYELVKEGCQALLEEIRTIHRI